MMSISGYERKKDLRESIGKRLQVIETSMFGSEFNPDGVNAVVGPSPLKRSWYAQVTCEGGIIKKVT